ncbi:MAG: hypothetical protein E7351_00625 [Clostridiales bacterium]|nr:hypothetical protein [Clostridiales bacterium]
MNEEINAYVEYIKKIGTVHRPKMPKFDISAYSDNEYLSAIEGLNVDFDAIDDEYLTIRHLKGD